VIHEETGLLVDSNEPSRVATAIKTLLNDDGARQEMGRRGLELVKKFDWQVVAASYIELYQNLLRCSSHPRRV
jgi:glycosyltransferase involved in cell wall biosynthesis